MKADLRKPLSVTITVRDQNGKQRVLFYRYDPNNEKSMPFLYGRLFVVEKMDMRKAHKKAKPTSRIVGMTKTPKNLKESEYLHTFWTWVVNDFVEQGYDFIKIGAD